jgi:hypothetical protein
MLWRNAYGANIGPVMVKNARYSPSLPVRVWISAPNVRKVTFPPTTPWLLKEEDKCPKV